MLVAGFLAVLCVPQITQAKSWSFDRWNVTLDVQADASLVVREEQTFRFEGPFTWITRDLPASKGIWYSDIHVYDGSGSELTGTSAHVTNRQTSASIKVDINQSDTTATYTFAYTVWNAVGYFDTYDELYWNVVSNDRDVPIADATATVRLPTPLRSTSDWRQRLLIGATGSTEESTDFSVIDAQTVRFHAVDIFANDNMTIVAGWPKGVVTETHRSVERSAAAWLLFGGSVAAAILFPLVTLIVLVRRWRRTGRDPKGRKTIVPQYDPPDKTTPAVTGTVVDEKASSKELMATIIDLAVRGYLTIEETRGGLFNKRSYIFHKTPHPRHGESLQPYEQSILDGLFEQGDDVALSDLKNKFYQRVNDITKGIYDASVKVGYFSKSPMQVRINYWVTGGVLVAAGVGLGSLLPSFAVPSDGISAVTTLGLPLGIGVSGVITALFGKAMPSRTPKGVAAKEWAQGFKLYLTTAERYRVRAMTPETFERMLPYAMVFGVEKEWAKSFEGILTQPPSWYGGYNAATFSALAFTSDFSNAMTSTIAQTLSSSPSSNSGFGGGGFGGGGGGGGGSGAG